MSQLVYPTFPGGAFPTRTVIAPPVKIKTTPSGREFRARDSVIPKYRYSQAFSCLRLDQARQEYQQLLGFFNRVGGTFDDWLFDDVDDNTCVDQLIGVADGVTTQFQLGRTLGGFIEPLYGGVNGVAVVKVSGSVWTPTSISPTGVITLAFAPSAGSQIRWSGKFYWRCVFAAETLEFVKNFATFYEAKKVEFRTVKPL